MVGSKCIKNFALSLLWGDDEYGWPVWYTGYCWESCLYHWVRRLFFSYHLTVNWSSNFSKYKKLLWKCRLEPWGLYYLLNFFFSSFGEEILSHHKDVMKELISRDKNHPSIIAWSIANEPYSDLPIASNYFRWEPGVWFLYFLCPTPLEILKRNSLLFSSFFF